MKLEAMIEERDRVKKENAAVSAESVKDDQQSITTWLEGLGFAAADGWDIWPMAEQVAVVVHHESLPCEVIVSRGFGGSGYVAGRVLDDISMKVIVERWEHILPLLESPALEPDREEWKPEDSLTVRALEVVAKLKEARTEHVKKLVLLADADRGLREQQALAEQRAIMAIGGEKELGSNAEARARALTIALAEDRTYQEVLPVNHRLQESAKLTEVEVLGLADELKVVLAAMRREERDADQISG